MPAIDLWVYGEQVRSGQIKLQTGQWVICGDANRKSRFVHANKAVIYAVHPHSKGVENSRFADAVKSWPRS